MSTIKNIPDEVSWYISVVGGSGGLLGTETYNKCKAIEEKYPDWFPWEAKYRSIPKEVHDAYFKERNPDWGKPIDFKGKEGGFDGLIPQLKKGNYQFLDLSSEELEKFSVADSIVECFEVIEKNRKAKLKRNKMDEALWDKHYKKHGLKYRK